MHIRFGLPAELPPPVKAQIKRADRISAWLEAVHLAGFDAAEADRFFGAAGGSTGWSSLRLRPPAEVKLAFLARHEALMRDCEAALSAATQVPGASRTALGSRDCVLTERAGFTTNHPGRTQIAGTKRPRDRRRRSPEWNSTPPAPADSPIKDATEASFMADVIEASRRCR